MAIVVLSQMPSSKTTREPDWSVRYAEDAEEASARYAIYKTKDPLPKIQPSLLNSIDLACYVAATGLIVPFRESKRKSASYGVPLKGEVIYWDGNGQECHFYFGDREKDKKAAGSLPIKSKFILEKNSIAFVTLEPYFRVPNYIALRYDFTIREIYRGLLLGTGPLVDPGFQGRLSIPIHNLTNNDYVFQFDPDDEGIWFELTKMTIDKEWITGDTREGAISVEYAPFPERKNESRKNVSDYIEHALEGQAAQKVESSIPPAIREVQKQAVEAQSVAKNIRNWVVAIGSLGLVGFFFGLFAGYQFISDAWNMADTAERNNLVLERGFDGLARDIERSIETDRSFGARIDEFEAQVRDLQLQIELLRNKAGGDPTNSVLDNEGAGSPKQ